MIERLFVLSSIIIVLRFVEDPREIRMNLDFDLETRKGLDFNLGLQFINSVLLFIKYPDVLTNRLYLIIF